MILKTTAIVLRINPFSRTSRVVTWLSPDYGRIVTIIKGACRAKSAFLGQYDLASRCELLFYRREYDGVHIARECTPLAWRPALHDDWRRALAAGYLCELCNRVSMPMLEAVDLFAELECGLGALEAGESPETTIIRFELALLDALGLAPDFSPCHLCCRDESTLPTRFSLAAGRLRCHHTTPLAPAEASVALNSALHNSLQQWQRYSREPDKLLVPTCDPATLLAIRRFLYMFLQHHLDTPLLTHQTTFAWLDSDVTCLPANNDSTVLR